jgi:uncharacterized membrane protein
VGIIAFYRWYKTPLEERFFISITISLPRSETKLDRALSTILLITIIITILTLILVVSTPRRIEKSTEFYLLGEGGKTSNYPKNLNIGKNAGVIIGLINHEYKIINYTIEVWLINQTITSNQSVNQNDIIYNHMWFMKKINVTLSPAFYNTSMDEKKIWESQWEYNYTFYINRTGKFTLIFLLFTTSTDEYAFEKDYSEIAKWKIGSAYEEIHLWLTVI